MSQASLGTGDRLIAWFSVRRVLLPAGVLVITLILAAAILHVIAQPGLAEIEAELAETVAVETWAIQNQSEHLFDQLLDADADSQWRQQMQQTRRNPRAESEIPHCESRTDLELVGVESHLTQVVVTAFCDSGNETRELYRETRFYRETDEGWKQTMPRPDYWGSLQMLETDSFVFHFYEHDRAIVQSTADRVERMSRQVRIDLSLPVLADEGKSVISIFLDSSQAAPAGDVGVRFVESPSLKRIPAGFAPSDLLYYVIAVWTFNRSWEEKLAQHPLEWQGVSQRKHLFSALRLWQIWDADTPLARWQEPTIQWIYRANANDVNGRETSLPEWFDEMCNVHQFWNGKPLDYSIPSVCISIDHSIREVGTPNAAYLPPRGLNPYASPQRIQPGTMVALTSAIEYGVAEYGRERLPMLWTAFGSHQSWETLLPAVFGVPSDEFDAGWADFLAERYGIRQ